MKLRSILVASALAMAIIYASVSPVDTAGTMYASRRKQVRAAIALMRPYDSSGFPTGNPKVNAYPYVFYIMDRRADLKPRGWDFVNPLAPPNVGKNHSMYWEVDLEKTSLENLTKLDLLYICARTAPWQFPMDIRDKLRQFVDAGGVLWLDNPDPNSAAGLRFSNDAANVFFIDRPGQVSSSNSGYPLIFERHHSLVTSPFWLTELDVAFMGYDSDGTGRVKNALEKTDRDLPPAFLPIVTVGQDPNKAYVAGVEYGSGKIVVTAGGIGGAIQPVGGIAPSCAAGMAQSWSALPGCPYATAPTMSDLDIQRVSRPQALKMAYNIANWATSYNGFRKNARHTGFAPEGMSTGHVRKWRFDKSPDAASEASVAIHKNVFFYVADGTLYALDGAPEEDLDSNGNPNDGFQNEPPGADYDIIWQANVGPSSSPVCFTAPVKSGSQVDTIDCVMVQTADGNVLIFKAFPSSPSGILLDAPELIQSYALGGGGGARNKVPAPTYFNNHIYAAGNDACIWSIHWDGINTFVNNANTWFMPKIVSGGPKPYQELIGSPTVGFVEHRTNGALIAMVFCLARPYNPGGFILNDQVVGVPVFVSGERVARKSGNRYTYQTIYAAASGALISLNPTSDVLVKDALGNRYAGTFTVLVNQQADANGQVSAVQAPGYLVIKQTNGDPLPDGCQVYVTYAVDYATGTGNDIRAPINAALPPQVIGTTSSQIQTFVTPAMGPEGLFYFPAGETGSASGGGTTGGDTLYAMQYTGGERSGGSVNPVTTAWLYKLPKFSSDPNNMALVDPPAGGKSWAIKVTGPGGADVPLADPRFTSTPAVARDKVFATVTGSNGGALLCFKARSNFVIRVSQSNPDAAFIDPTTRSRRLVRLWQPDTTGSWGIPVAEATAVPREMIDTESGTITITDFGYAGLVMRAGTSGLGIKPAPLTPSLPVWVLVNNVVLSPDQVDLSGWDNLLWYFVPTHEGGCRGIDSPPTVIGDRVYFVCNDGWLYAVDASPGLSDHKRLDDKSKVWSKKIGIGSQGVWNTVSASNGLLAVIARDDQGNGLQAFDDPVTLIADSNRAIELDGNAEPMWSCDSLIHRNPIPGAQLFGMAMAGAQRQAINRPSKIRSFGPSDYLIVDSGNNQVARMTRSGEVTAVVRTFTDNYRRLLKSGEPLELRGPTDASVWAELEGGKLVHHWLIADAGNHRVIDLVQRFDPSTGARVIADPSGGGDIVAPDANAPPELNWMSLATDIGRNYRFNSAQIVGEPGTNKQEIWVAAGNWTTEERSYGVPGGSILRLSYRDRPGSWQPTSAPEWKYQQGVVIGQIDAFVTLRGQKLKMSNPRYLRVFNFQNTWHALLCESRGVFEIMPGPEDGVAAVYWSLTNETGVDLGGLKYQALPRDVVDINGAEVPKAFDLPIVKLDAAHAQLLPNGNVLITNSHSESDASGNRFNGEVFEVANRMDPSKASIVWYAPKIREKLVQTPAGPVIVPAQAMIGTYNLTQPMSAERVF